jgi:hypothetical protein
VDPNAYLEALPVVLRRNGFEVTSEEVGGRRAVVGRRSDFRWRWFAVRLHTAVVAAPFDPAEAHPELLDRFLAEASRWAVEHRRSGRLGIQTGTAAVAVAVLPSMSEEVRAWASKPHGRHFAAIAYPVAVDASSGSVVNPQRMVVGGIFSSFLRNLVRDVVSVPLVGGR